MKKYKEKAAEWGEKESCSLSAANEENGLLSTLRFLCLRREGGTKRRLNPETGREAVERLVPAPQHGHSCDFWQKTPRDNKERLWLLIQTALG